MNDALLQQISKYAEDREIDYISAKVIGEQQGIDWKNETQLVEFKQVIDMYLKTFDIEKFKLVEMKIETLSGKKARTPEEAEKLTSYASKPRSDKKVSKKKAVKEAKESTWSCKSKDGKIKVEESRAGVFDVYRNGRKIDTLKNVTRRQISQQMRESSPSKKINEERDPNDVLARKHLEDFLSKERKSLMKWLSGPEKSAKTAFMKIGRSYAAKNIKSIKDDDELTAGEIGDYLGKYALRNLKMREQ